MLLVKPLPESFEHAEERRLFYVALTRARLSLTMLTVARKHSPFVRELAISGAVKIIDAQDSDTHYQPCPNCRDGMLVARENRRGTVFLGCTGYPKSCTHTQSL